MKLAKLLAGSALFAAFAFASTVGCEGATCEEGGGVIVEGKCEGKCDASKCLENNTCLNNRCALKCTSHLDCLDEQTCTPVKDDAGEDVTICQYASEFTQQIGIPCPNGGECEAFSACPDGSPCGADVDSPSCPAEQCRPLICLTSGPGDQTAYCTSDDCSTDEDCKDGMYCGIRRDPRMICGTMKGTEDPCLDPADFTKDGATFQEGPISLLRNVCRKSASCAPCESDLDCSIIAGQGCTTLDGAKVCAPRCTVKKDCESDADCTDGFCVPSFKKCKGTGQFCEPCTSDLDCAGGGDAAYCAKTAGNQRACFDNSFAATCGGACIQCQLQSAVCVDGDPCTNSSQCYQGKCDGATMMCKECKTTPVCKNGDTCNDPSDCFTGICEGKDVDCPTSPGGKHGECLDEFDGVTPATGVYLRCYLPLNDQLGRFECW